jgi:phosphatidate cytidylyltransferase
MLKTRLITASILIVVLLLALFYASPMVWSFLVGTFVLAGFWEWGRIINLKNSVHSAFMMIAMAMSFCILYAFHVPEERFNEQFLLVIVTLATFIWLLLVPYLLSRHSKLTQHQGLMGLVGLFLLSATLIAFIGLHRISPWLLIGIIATVSIADSAAYFSGKNFGKRKLAPTISPGKTWEGVMGGLVAVTIYGLLLKFYLHYSTWLLVGLWAITVVSVMGDLFESKLKRLAGLKDSGQLLPGHGGVLDRIDGLMPALTLTLFYIYFPLIIPT